MASPETLTQSSIFHSKQGVNLDYGSDGLEVQEFNKLTKLMKDQAGCLLQYWGHQVQTPRLFMWLIDWQSMSHYTKFHDSEDYKTFKNIIGSVFDLTACPPFTTFANWASDAKAALSAPVTEFAYFSLPDGTGEKGKNECWEKLITIPDYVTTVGGAVGSATGWVTSVDPPEKAKAPWLHGVFGWPSTETHMRWREMPEIQAPVKVFKELAEMGLMLSPAIEAPGVGSKTGWFHVHFHVEV